MRSVTAPQPQDPRPIPINKESEILVRTLSPTTIEPYHRPQHRHTYYVMLALFVRETQRDVEQENSAPVARQERDLPADIPRAIKVKVKYIAWQEGRIFCVEKFIVSWRCRDVRDFSQKPLGSPSVCKANQLVREPAVAHG